MKNRVVYGVLQSQLIANTRVRAVSVLSKYVPSREAKYT